MSSREPKGSCFFLSKLDADEYNGVLEDKKHKLFWGKNFISVSSVLERKEIEKNAVYC